MVGGAVGWLRRGREERDKTQTDGGRTDKLQGGSLEKLEAVFTWMP